MKTKSIIILFLSVLFTGSVYAKNVKVKFIVEMDCVSCKQKIEKNIAFEKGVKALDVNLEKQTVEITYNDEKTDVAKLQRGFMKIGYNAIVAVPKPCCSEKSSQACKDACKSNQKSVEACETKDC